MFKGVLRHIRRQPAAFVALFFALGGGAMAASNFIKPTDTIRSGDLAGSTYGSPTIANGAVTAAKTDPTTVQQRVSGTCSSGSAVSSVDQSGSVGCHNTGLAFATGSGRTGPTLTEPGQYLVMVKAEMNTQATAPSNGVCRVTGATLTDPPTRSSTFFGSFDHAWEANFSFSGIITAPDSASATNSMTTQLDCFDDSSNAISPDPINWWVTKAE
jgi:hypothetical protein